MPKVSRLNSAFVNPAFLNTSISVAVDAEQLLHRETDRRGEFYDAEMSAFFQYPAHFLQSLIQVLEVPDTEGCGYSVEALVLE